MDFYDVVSKRASIREFEDEKISSDVIKRIMDAAYKAPTNDHFRDYEFVVLDDKKVIKEALNGIPKNLSVKDVDDIVKVGQENGWQFFTDDFANPDCVKHYKREVIIRKVIKGTETDLAGATLVLTNAAGETIATWVSDGTGKVFTDLPVGKYTVTETVAPAGYNLGKIEFEITAEQDEYSLTFKVEDSPIPETGDINFTLIITAFILFLGFGIFGLIKTSKREDM